MTKQYERFRKIVADSFSVDMIKDLQIVLSTAWANALNETEKAEILRVWKPVLTLHTALMTDKLCPHCKAFLYLSDLPDYNYVCPFCYENFYECEV